MHSKQILTVIIREYNIENVHNSKKNYWESIFCVIIFKFFFIIVCFLNDVEFTRFAQTVNISFF